MNTKPVYELSGIALDYAVAVAEGWSDCEHTHCGHYCFTCHNGDYAYYMSMENFTPSTSWDDAGPIIERERIRLDTSWMRERGDPDDGLKHPKWKETRWAARIDGYVPWIMGDTPMEAAMRVFVMRTLGTEIEIPEDLECCR